MNLENMTIEQLKALKQERYNEAREEGTLRAIASICRELGEDPAGPGYVSRYGPKRVWKQGDITVYVDDYGAYMTVSVEGKKVCSTHPCDQFIIPGDWIDAVLAHYSEAQERVEQREARQLTNERSRLMAHLD